MTKIKLCGLSQPRDIEVANALKPEYIGFVFAPGSKRYLPPEQAAELKRMLAPGIRAVGVFVRETPETIAELLDREIIDIAQLHGGEDENLIRRLRGLTGKPIIKAFRIDSAKDLAAAESSTADFVLLDSGSGGTGMAFDWTLIGQLQRPYFLAGGLGSANVAPAIRLLHPYAVDVSSGIETNGVKDPTKMEAFVAAARQADAV